MITTNIPTLKIHKLTQSQYERELENGTIDENAIYLTPEESIDLSAYATKAELNEKADKSHGTHVSFATTAPVMDGTAAVGTATTVARSDHKHPTDTSRASQADVSALASAVINKATISDLNSHTGDTTKHITSSERTTWNAKANASDIPTKVSQLTNDTGFITSAPVTSVNSKTGAITLSASDVNAYSKSEIDSMIGDIATILRSI